MPIQGIATVAGGNIKPKRIVRVTAPHTVSSAGDASTNQIGISGRDTRNFPMTGLDDGFHAIAGESVVVFGPGEIAPLVTGAAVSAGAYVQPDSDSRGVAAGAGEPYVGMALTSSAAANEEILVLVMPGSVPA